MPVQTVLVTGGSRGIGEATVRAFTARGDQVYFIYEKEHAAAAAVAAQTGATAICCDVANGEDVQKAFARLPQLDILVCNAGISVTGLLQDMQEDQWDRLFDVNVKGIYHCVKAAMPLFLQKQKGSIVTVSSMWGQVGASCEVGYSATKGAVIAMTKALAQELGPCGVRVNCVAPGVIQTDMCKAVDPAIMEELRQQTPIGKLGKPEDVAQTIVHLADAAFITGQVLGINGGFVV